jgi:hypothetical protein
LRIADDAVLSPMWPGAGGSTLRYKIGRLVIDNGSTNAAKVKAFRMHRTFYGAGHVMPRERSVDTDEQSDYNLACWYANKLGYR